MPQWAAGYGLQLEYLMTHDPEMRALIAAAPQAGRILRPLLHMCGITPHPDVLPPLPPRVRRTASPRPERPGPQSPGQASPDISAKRPRLRKIPARPALAVHGPPKPA